MPFPLTSLLLGLAQASASAPPDRALLIWAVVAFGLALILVVVEAFLPSGGIFGFLAGACAITGIVLFFNVNTRLGLFSMAVTLLALPFLIAGLLWIWPHTIVGRALTLDDAQEPVLGGEPGEEANVIDVGLEGTAETDLRPVGSCRLGGQRVDCLAVTGVIPAGTTVRVWAVEGDTIRVKPAGHGS